MPSGNEIFEPAVIYTPASTMQSSPRLIPIPELAPSKVLCPIEITSLPPPLNVPMIEAPPPISLPSPTTTPALILPSTIDFPKVPALKFTNPSCITVVPGDR